MTIEDISKLAKVSKTTVSRYLNGKYEYMSAKTRARIESIIGQYQYRPNQIARSLKTKKSNLIALISQGMSTQTNHIFLRGLEEALWNTEYDYIALSCGNDFQRECRCFERCVDQQVAAIGYSPVSPDLRNAVAVNEKGTPVVLVDRYSRDWPYSAVYINQYALVNQALDHLRERGYEDILLITYAVSGLDNRYIRELAFRDYFQKWKGGVSDELVFRIEETAGIQDAIQKRLKAFIEKPGEGRKAVFATNMNLLHTIIQAGRRLNLSYPEDYGLCGFDSWEWARLLKPSVTYLDQPQYQEGLETGRLLLDIIETREKRRKQIIELHGSISIGDSTGD